MTYSKHLPVKDKPNNLKKIGFSYTADAETVSNAAVFWSKSKIKITVITIAVTFVLVALTVGLTLGLRRSSSEQNEPSQFTPPPFDSKSIPTKYRAPKSFKMPEPLFPNATHSCENSLRLGLVGFMGKGKVNIGVPNLHVILNPPPSLPYIRVPWLTFLEASMSGVKIYLILLNQALV